MRNRKQILATLLMGVLASFMILDITGGSIPGNVPATVHAAELESDAQDEMVSAGVFTDVDPGQYYYRPVYWALENDITAGTTPTTFSPGDNCTRAQTVSFLWRMAGEPEPESIKTNFADVPTNRFFSKAVAWAVENKITSGKTSTTFDPYGICTRAEFVSFLYRAAGNPEVHNAGTSFTDVESVRYYARPVAWAVENGVTAGTTPTTFSPDNICRRGQVVSFLYRWRTTINVQNYGATPNDDTDDTDAINEALIKASEDASVETVYIPSGTYIVNAESGIKVWSNTNLTMASDTVLDVTGNSQENYNVIRTRNAQNITISGGKIQGERNKHNGSSGEWGMGIGLYDSSNVTISNVTITGNWGDGIYLGTRNETDDLYGCDNIRIENCNIYENRRSNISIVDADNVTIDNCTISNAGGTAPQCGINIEPNHDENGRIPEKSICRNIRITNTTVNVLGKDDYYGQYFCFRTQRYTDRSIVTSDNILIDSCTFNGDAGNYSGTNMTISNSVIRGTFYDMCNTTLNNVDYENIWRG